MPTKEERKDKVQRLTACQCTPATFIYDQGHCKGREEEEILRREEEKRRKNKGDSEEGEKVKVQKVGQKVEERSLVTCQ